MVVRKTRLIMSIVVMNILKWMSGVTRDDKIKNKYVIESIDVLFKVDKKREWFVIV